jgi:hypothetical protein
MSKTANRALVAALGLPCVMIGCGDVAGPGVAVQAVVAPVCPGTVTADDRGDPRDAEGHVRYCWPGEARCLCDADNDCYDQEGYVACTPPSGGTPPPSPAPDAGTATDAGTPAPPPPVDAGAPSPGPAGPALPAFDAPTAAHVRDLATRGAARGNARDVVAKIGDSITESASFLMDCGHGWYELGAYGDLGSTIQYFSARSLPGGENSLARSSLSATAGWTVADALAGGDPASPLARELDAIRPQWAVVMYGTNDLDRVDVATYRANLGRVVDLIESRAAVAVLSTIPPRADTQVAASRVGPFNDAVRALAAERHVPLLDYWAALRPLPAYGVSADGIHPNTLHGSDACVFTAEGLRYGYNVRSLTALQMLARLRGY